jgi:hypothetical protein
MADKDERKHVDDALQSLDPAKRLFLKALIAGAGFGAPMVASFSMKGVSSYTVHAAAGSNIT